MSDTASRDGVDQCIALTGDGQRCSRPAGPGGFCFQHDESSPTIEEAEDVDADTLEGALKEKGEIDMADENQSDNGDSGEDEASQQESSDDTTEESVEIEGSVDIGKLRNSVRTTTDQLIGRPLDGVVSIGKRDGGWRVVVDCLERKSIPDTQDILGQYEIEFSEDGDVIGYQRRHRYRRGDTVEDEQADLVPSQ